MHRNSHLPQSSHYKKHQQSDVKQRSIVAANVTTAFGQPQMKKTTQSNSHTRGLRHFSSRVCSKVEEKGITNYNQVANELIEEIFQDEGKVDEKNIRRRVYDALNVLMAIGVIDKNKKDIKWLGLPAEMRNEYDVLMKEKALIEKRVQAKKEFLQSMLSRYVCLTRLIYRNYQLQIQESLSSDRTNVSQQQQQSSTINGRLHVPFALLETSPECHINCEMLEDRSQYHFEMDKTFTISDDSEILEKMNFALPSVHPNLLRICNQTDADSINVPLHVENILPSQLLGFYPQ